MGVSGANSTDEPELQCTSNILSTNAPRAASVSRCPESARRVGTNLFLAVPSAAQLQRAQLTDATVNTGREGGGQEDGKEKTH